MKQKNSLNNQIMVSFVGSYLALAAADIIVSDMTMNEALLTALTYSLGFNVMIFVVLVFASATTNEETNESEIKK